tara:strand:+ start:35 stop:613 length:579 start_codon:yes stop_codon:yes gene_type:complete
MALTKVRGAGAEGLTLSSTSLTIANGLTLTDGNVTLASGHGIDFAATANSSATGASLVSELFDDYEEGFWTPTISSGWSSFTTDFLEASYVKIGHMCYLTCSMRFSGTNANATVKIDGLPYASRSNADGYASGSGAIGYANMFTVVNHTVSTVYVVQNSSRIQMYTMLGAAVNSNADASNRWLEFSAAYPTA